MTTNGRIHVGTLKASERGQHVTIVCCMNAIGNFIPPSLVFVGKHMESELIYKAQRSSLGFPHGKGYMNGNTVGSFRKRGWRKRIAYRHDRLGEINNAR